MTLYAVHICLCKYETGYRVQSVHSTFEKALIAIKREQTQYLDGLEIIEFQVDKFNSRDPETFKVVHQVKDARA